MKILCIFLIFFLICQSNAKTDNVSDAKIYEEINEYFDFVFDALPDDVLPNKLRASGGPYLKKISDEDKRSLDALSISGSRQFNRAQLTSLIYLLTAHKKVPKDKIYIIDLREEAHLFMDEHSVTLAHKKATASVNIFHPFMGIAPQTIQAFEDKLVNFVQCEQNKAISIIDKKKFFSRHKKINISSVDAQTERAVVESLGVHYKRFSVTDHKRPTDALLDDFINFFQNLPPDVWLHFHCRGGSGRTSSFMIMVDILKNAKTDSLDKIVSRNNKMGNSKKIFDISQIPSNKLHDGIVRRDFLIKFYEFAKTAYGKKTWSEWIKE
ncbi:MAG: hypothetical protein CNLJKLNK_00120 [Holosporales bacterium]